MDENASIAAKAFDLIVERPRGIHFFLQEWASTTWNEAQGPVITVTDAERAYAETIATLDAGFFRVRMDRLTKTEIQFVKAMAGLGDGPYAVADIAKAFGRSQSSIGPTRASIIKKGMVYSTEHGFLNFTVPLFAPFMRRNA